MTSRSAHYGAVSIALHWGMAVLIVANLCLGLYFVQMHLSPTKLSLISLHKWTGVTVFLLCLARLLWRLLRPAPAFPTAAIPAWQQRTAKVMHALLYLLMVAVPLTGWLYSSSAGVPTVYFGVSALQIPDLLGKDVSLAAKLKFIHKTLNYSLGALVLVHLTAALKHQIIDRDGVLTRMMPFLRTSPK